MRLHREGKLEEAAQHYAAILRAQPNHFDALHRLGVVRAQQGRLADGLDNIKSALKLQPTNVEALSNLGLVLGSLGRLEEALASYDGALAIRPGFADALINRGTALQDLERPAEALASYDKALAIGPDNAAALYNRGIALRELKRAAEALASYDKALAIRPGFAAALHNRGMTNLLMGDLPAGWAGCEHRWDREGAPQRRLIAPYPVWKGEDIQGQRIIVYEEQGFGDIIQFSRYLTRLSAAGASVTFLVRSSMHRLLRPFTPTIRLIDEPPPGESFDLQCALLSLPAAFGTTLDTVPADIPYLIPEAPLIAGWQRRIGNHGLKIGICWQGNPSVRVDIGRSFPLRSCHPIAAVPGVRLISIQKSYGLDQLTTLPSGMTVETLGAELDDFVDTAAVIANLDLVITCDTSMAHLAGALGHPVWVVLKHVPEWRWMLDREDSPWYPTARLFRQRRPGDWDEVFERMATELAQIISGERDRLLTGKQPISGS